MPSHSPNLFPRTSSLLGPSKPTFKAPRHSNPLAACLSRISKALGIHKKTPIPKASPRLFPKMSSLLSETHSVPSALNFRATFKSSLDDSPPPPLANGGVTRRHSSGATPSPLCTMAAPPPSPVSRHTSLDSPVIQTPPSTPCEAVITPVPPPKKSSRRAVLFAPVTPQTTPVHEDDNELSDRPATSDAEDEEEDDEDVRDPACPYTPVNVAQQWETLEELRLKRRYKKVEDAKRYNERVFTIRRGHNAFALIVPFGDKPLKEPVHMELRFPPTDEQVKTLALALNDAKFAEGLKDQDKFEVYLSKLEYHGRDSRRAELEAHAYMRAHVPGYKKGKKKVEMKKTLAAIRELRPAPSPVSRTPSPEPYSATTPEPVQDFRWRRENKVAAAQIDGSTPWAAPERRGLRAISLRKKMEEEEEKETGTKKRRAVKRKKLEYDLDAPSPTL